MDLSSLISAGPFDRRPTYAEVDIGALSRNFAALKGFSKGAKMLAVVKANGYGHGLAAMGRVYERLGADYLGVAYIEEALELRRNGVALPIIVFGGLLEEQLSLYIENDIDVTAPSVSKLQQIDAAAARLGRRARVHLKIDTGLERLGVHYYSAETLFDAALRVQHADIVGVFSHFAEVDPQNLSLARTQLDRFLTALSPFESRVQSPIIRHIAASGALLAMPESHLDMVRPGIVLYGVYPGPGFESFLPLEPTLSLKSRVVYFKVVREGAGVSYGHKWHAPHDTRVVTIPVGYGDGYSRQLSNKASVIIRGQRKKVVGAVCMDQFMVDLGPEGEGYNRDEVVLIGSQGGERVSVEELAAIMNTAPQEILVMLNQRIPRVYVGNLS